MRYNAITRGGKRRGFSIHAGNHPRKIISGQEGAGKQPGGRRIARWYLAGEGSKATEKIRRAVVSNINGEYRKIGSGDKYRDGVLVGKLYRLVEFDAAGRARYRWPFVGRSAVAARCSFRGMHIAVRRYRHRTAHRAEMPTHRYARRRHNQQRQYQQADCDMSDALHLDKICLKSRPVKARLAARRIARRPKYHRSMAQPSVHESEGGTRHY